MIALCAIVGVSQLSAGVMASCHGVMSWRHGADDATLANARASGPKYLFALRTQEAAFKPGHDEGCGQGHQGHGEQVKPPVLLNNTIASSSVICRESSNTWLLYSDLPSLALTLNAY